jgi:hypothetical protein
MHPKSNLIIKALLSKVHQEAPKKEIDYLERAVAE